MRHRFARRFINSVVLGLVFALPFLVAQEPRSNLPSVIAALRNAKLDDIPTKVPADVARNLTDLKHRLRDIIVQKAQDANESVTADALTAAVANELENQAVSVGDEFEGYGAIQSIKFEQRTEYPQWLIATVQISIPYGNDTSLYLFELHQGRWKYSLGLESNGYKQIQDAQGGLSYEVHRLAGGKPYLIATEVSPSSISVWQALRLRVLRPGRRPDTPILLLRKILSYCIEEPYEISANARGFGLIYLGWPVDPELAGYRGVHYLKVEMSNHRLAIRQSAIDPSNYLQQWITSDWRSALRRVSPDNVEAVAKWHDRLRRENWNCQPGSLTIEEQQNRLFAIATCRYEQPPSQKVEVKLEVASSGFRVFEVSSTGR